MTRRTKDLDSKDCEILALLENDSRKSISDISRSTGLSAPTVTERIARLKDIGVIRRFTTDIDHSKIGLHVGAVIHFKPHRSGDRKITEAVSALPEVRSAYLVTGSCLLVLIVRTASNDDLSRFLADLNKLGDTETSLILSTLDESRQLFGA